MPCEPACESPKHTMRAGMIWTGCAYSLFWLCLSSTVDRVREISLKVTGELADVFDRNERVVAVVIERPYMRQVYVP